MSGKVSFFGLNSFGSPVGVNPTWGAAIGAVSSTGAAVAFRALTSAEKHQYSELVGVGTGTLASAVMFAMKKTRAAGWASFFATIGSQGVLALERFLMKSSMQGIVMERTAQIKGLGLNVMDQVPQIRGTTGAPSLSNPAAAQVAQSVPGINGLAKHFGATIFG